MTVGGCPDGYWELLLVLSGDATVLGNDMDELGTPSRGFYQPNTSGSDGMLAIFLLTSNTHPYSDQHNSHVQARTRDKIATRRRTELEQFKTGLWNIKLNANEEIIFVRSGK